MLHNKDMEKMDEELEVEHIGTVEDHKDPLGLGRLKVRIPEIYGDIPTEHLPWSNPSASFGGGKGYGVFMIPIPGSKVRVRLFRGHPWTPEWTGVHWFKDEPPLESQISPPHNYLIKTPKGHLIDMHDDNKYIRIRDLNGNYVTLDTSKDDLKIFVGHDVLEEAKNNVDETIGKSKHTKTGQFIDEKIGSSRRTKAQVNIDFQAGVSINIKATATVNIEASGIVNVKAGGIVAIDGASVLINSGAAQSARPQDPE